MTTLFSAKTPEGFIIKILSELLTVNLPTASLQINKNGITLRMESPSKKAMIDVWLDALQFSVWTFKAKKQLNVGITLSNLHKMLKSVKKKDSVQLSIDERNPNELEIKAIPKENTRVTTSYVKTTIFQNLVVSIPGPYRKPVIVVSSEFSKAMKELVNMSKYIKMRSKKFYLMIDTSSPDEKGDILKRKIEFGEKEFSNEDESECVQTFETEQLVKTAKISGLGTSMQIFTSETEPLKLCSTIGSLGTISIYLKSIEQIQKLNDDKIMNVEESDESSEEEDGSDSDDDY